MFYEEVFERIDRHARLKEGARLLRFEQEGAEGWIRETPETVHVFASEQGLKAHLELMNKVQPVMWEDGPVVQDCIQLAYVDRDELDKADYALIKEMGRSYRGRKKWPQMRRYRPYLVPWGLNEQDCTLLCAALDALRGDVQELEEESVVPEAMPLTAAEVSNELLKSRFARMQATPDAWDITVQAFPFPMGSDEENGAPCCPLMLLAVDEPSDQVICLSVSPVSEKNYAETLAQDLMAEAVKRGRKPRIVRFANAKAEQLLGGLFEEMGIASEREYRLPQLKDAFESLLRFASGDAEE